MILDVERFAAQERPYWQDLERELRRIEEGAEPEPGVRAATRLHTLYERAAADLARVRTFSADAELESYLEQLVARAHAAYQPRGRARLDLLVFIHWFAYTFPQAFRRNLRPFLISCALTVAGVLAGAGFLLVDEETKPSVLPFPHLMVSPSERVAQEESADRSPGLLGGSTFSAQLMTHNIRVSMLAMAAGITFGAGTLALLFYNGVILGVVGCDYIADGQTVFLLAWLLPHGTVEIPAILIAGQAGLIIGGAMLGLGQGASLAARFRAVSSDLVTLIGGAATLLVWAGLIEAFFSQVHEPLLPYWVKIAFGTVQLAALAAFLHSSGRDKGATV